MTLLIGVIEIKLHLIVLSAKSCKVLSVETGNENFQCETGARQLSVTEGRDVDALAGQEIPASKQWDNSCEGDLWHPWISKENSMRDSGKRDTIIVQIITQSIGTRAFRCSWSSPLGFCIALDTPVKKMLNYNSRRAGDLVIQMDRLLHEVRLKTVVCLALASWTNEGTGYSTSFYTQLGLNSKKAEKLSQKIPSAQDQIV